MDNLRLILIVGGAVLLAGIYLWGVAFAKRRDYRATDEDFTDPLDEDLESIQDIRAAQNVESLIDLENFDIDEDLDRDMPAGERLGERKPAPEEVESESNEISADGTEEILVEADSQKSTGDDDSAPTIEDADIPNLADIDFEPNAEDLSGIRATRESDDEIPIGQLDLLNIDAGNARPDPPASAPDEALDPDPGNHRAVMESTAVSITVMAREGQRFSGADLRRLLQSLDLEHGDMGIFHRRERGRSRRTPPLYSVANVVMPGTFDPEEMAEMTTPGVAMFMQLPGPDDPGAAFEEMIRAARKLASGLDGIVCDETRSTLTGQVINHLRERISEFSRKQRLRS